MQQLLGGNPSEICRVRLFYCVCGCTQQNKTQAWGRTVAWIQSDEFQYWLELFYTKVKAPTLRCSQCTRHRAVTFKNRHCLTTTGNGLNQVTLGHMITNRWAIHYNNTVKQQIAFDTECMVWAESKIVGSRGRELCIWICPLGKWVKIVSVKLA